MEILRDILMMSLPISIFRMITIITKNQEPILWINMIRKLTFVYFVIENTLSGSGE